MDGYLRGGHSKYSMKVHLIFVTKYRREIFSSQKRAEDLKRYVHIAAMKNKYKIIEAETDQDHIHILLEYNPRVSVSSIVRQLKQYTTYYMWRDHTAYMSRNYWKNRILWSDGYLACSIGQVSQKTKEAYIKNQG